MDSGGAIADHAGVAPRVLLFTTCLSDVVARRTADDAEQVLRALGCDVARVHGATCCGQPAFNSGHDAPARAVAGATLRALDDGSDDPIVVPSGSCTSMLRLHWRELFHGRPEADGAARVARRVRELSSFLADHADQLSALAPRLEARVGYHDSCHMLRELRLRDEPRAVLGRIAGLELVPLASGERCCGFGGTFSGRYPEVSTAMADSKIEDVDRSGIDLLVSADPGCLMQLEGRMSRTGSPVRVRHIASVLREALP